MSQIPQIRKVEIAICTLNRPSLLRNTLESIANASVPDAVSLRVIVVINSAHGPPSSESEKACADFAERLNLTVEHEPQTGHTFARNRAVSVATGDLLLWTDDDVIVASDWIVSNVSAANTSVGASFFGGKISPKFEAEQPDWIRENWDKLKGCFATRHLGDDEIPLTVAALPYGANFAVRTHVQKQFLFDTQLGRRGDAVLGEDEIEFFSRLLDAGHSGMWVPDSKLEHVIPADRATQDYVWNYFVGQGRALVSKGEPWKQTRASLKRTAIWQMLMWRFKRKFASSETWTSHLIHGALAEGQHRELSAKQIAGHES